MFDSDDVLADSSSEQEEAIGFAPRRCASSPVQLGDVVPFFTYIFLEVCLVVANHQLVWTYTLVVCSLSSAFTLSATVFLIRRAWTSHIRWAALCAMCNLGAAVTWNLLGLVQTKISPGGDQVLQVLVLLLISSFELLVCDLMVERVGNLAASTGFNLKPKCLHSLAVWVRVTGCLCLVPFLGSMVARQAKVQQRLQILTAALLVVPPVIFDSFTLWSLWEPLRAAFLAARGLEAISAKQGRTALKEVLFQVVGIPVVRACLVFRCMYVILYISGVIHLHMHFWQYSHAIGFAVNAIGVILLSGAYRVERPPSEEDAEIDRERMHRRRVMQDVWAACSDERWQAKVEELAGRGLTLQALLDFYLELPTTMPHFRPDVHTTGDVVRQAIIPKSLAGRAEGCSLASVMMGGACTRPKKMVSHHWSNLFRDLVAAVVADALGESDFGPIAFILERDPASLLHELRSRGRLQDTYWICAFSVSQHHSICGANPYGEVDSVSGLVHPICTCNTPKFFNSDPPLRDDGKSICCEMNKFSDMIGFLAAMNDEFEHVIAVDAHMEVFTRAWVISEIAQSHQMGVHQHIKLRDSSVLDKYANQLRHLRVEHMQATRKEDVEEILSGIPDKDAFNRHLRDVIFNTQHGLLASWKGADAAQRMVQVGRTLQIAHMALAEQDTESSAKNKGVH